MGANRRFERSCYFTYCEGYNGDNVHYSHGQHGRGECSGLRLGHERDEVYNRDGSKTVEGLDEENVADAEPGRLYGDHDSAYDGDNEDEEEPADFILEKDNIRYPPSAHYPSRQSIMTQFANLFVKHGALTRRRFQRYIQ